MRHQKAGRKFGRNTSHRRAMFRALAGNLVLHEKIQVTDTKAKELKRVIDRLLTKALRLQDDLVVDTSKISSDDEKTKVISRRVHSQREVAKFLPKQLTKTMSGGDTEDVDLIRKLFHDIAPRYLERYKAGKGGGYTRIIKLGHRKGDNAPISLIEFV